MDTLLDWIHEEVMGAVRDENLPPVLYSAFDDALEEELDKELDRWIQQQPATPEVKREAQPHLKALRRNILGAVEEVKAEIEEKDASPEEAAHRVAYMMRLHMD